MENNKIYFKFCEDGDGYAKIECISDNPKLLKPESNDVDDGMFRTNIYYTELNNSIEDFSWLDDGYYDTVGTHLWEGFVVTKFNDYKTLEYQRYKNGKIV